VDILEAMVAISRRLLANKNITILKIDGEHLPYPDGYFDLSFTSTVLQHITDEEMLSKIAGEICRVTGKEIYLFERVEKCIKGDELNLGRPVKYYQEIFGAHGYKLNRVRFLNVEISYWICGIIRKLFNSIRRREGEPVSKISEKLQELVLPLTSKLDGVFRANRDVGMLHFKKQG